MRRLLLLRHAKAERLPGGGPDRDRVLTARGRDDAKTIGAYLVRHRAVPDRALVSPAARTRETWELLSQAFRTAPPADFEDCLYDASPETLLGAIRDTRAGAATLLVVAHNPGMQELASLLVATGDIDARERLGRGFPTAALATITFAAEAWSDVHTNGGRLEHFVTPKSLAAATD
jgi:phosphohistidine phosphatase